MWRWLWLAGVTLVLVHTVILLAAAFGNRGSPRHFDVGWDQPSINMAMWLFEARPPYLLFNAVVNILMLALCVVPLRRRTRITAMAAMFGIRLICAAACAAALWQLAANSPIVVRTSPQTSTTFSFSDGTYTVRLALEGFLAIPALICGAMFLPVMRLDWLRSTDGRQFCPQCGYDLRGNPSNRCPECGGAA